MGRRLPAEWEAQDGVLLAWPHAGTDWVERLAPAQACLAAIAAVISRRERVLVIAPDPIEAESGLRAAGADLARVRIVAQDLDDTWCRDYGPLTVIEDGRPVLLDWGFNGWGLKYPAALDNRATRRLHAAGAFGATPLHTVGAILEGGSLECDGAGTFLTTSSCLLEANRNPHLDRQALSALLAKELGARCIHWLEHGQLAGDDTDGHVDTIARLCPGDTIAYQACTDPGDAHFAELEALAAELRVLRSPAGRPYRLVPLPWPRAVHDASGQRLPATYANFLSIDGAVLVPTYADPVDTLALAAIGTCFPGREVVGIDCRVLIEQHGSLHCMTMQIPKGVLA